MVPLPVRVELAALEVVVRNIRWLGLMIETGVGLDPGIGGLAQVPWQTNERKIIVPSDWNQETMRPALPWSDMMMHHHSPL